jgi:hypothetical protein
MKKKWKRGGTKKERNTVKKKVKTERMEGQKEINKEGGNEIIKEK